MADEYGMSVTELDLYIRWYEEDVIPGFLRQAAGRRGDNMYLDAVRRSRGHLERLRLEKAVKEAAISDVPEWAASRLSGDD